jgi:hypothetical protein
LRVKRLIAEFAFWLARIACKWLGFTLSFAQFRLHWSTLATSPKPTEQQSQKNEENPSEQVESQVESHDQPLQSGGK